MTDPIVHFAAFVATLAAVTVWAFYGPLWVMFAVWWLTFIAVKDEL